MRKEAVFAQKTAVASVKNGRGRCGRDTAVLCMRKEAVFAQKTSVARVKNQRGRCGRDNNYFQ